MRKRGFKIWKWKRAPNKKLIMYVVLFGKKSMIEWEVSATIIDAWQDHFWVINDRTWNMFSFKAILLLLFLLFHLLELCFLIFEIFYFCFTNVLYFTTGDIEFTNIMWDGRASKLFHLWWCMIRMTTNSGFNITKSWKLS